MEAINAFTPYDNNSAFPVFDGLNRYERALTISNTPKSIKKVAPKTYTVKSQFSFGVYVVNLSNADSPTCTCPDFQSNGHICKHIIAVQKHLKTIESKGKAHHRADGSVRKADYTNYNLAQMKEGELFKVYLRQLADMIDEPVREGAGRPSIPLSDQFYCAVTKVYSKLSSRRVHSSLREAETRGELENTPHFNVVSKFFAREDVTPLLYKMLRMSAIPLAETETEFAVDSSGFRTTTYTEWCDEKHGKTHKNQWIKAHISTGVKSNIIADAIITENNSADTIHFPALLTGTLGAFDVKEISADKGYLSDKNYKFGKEQGADVYIDFKKNVGKKGKCDAWKDAYVQSITNPTEFYKHYHKRSNVETTFFAVKQKFSDTLRSKSFIPQRNELLCKLIAYNITVLIQSMYLFDVEVKF